MIKIEVSERTMDYWIDSNNQRQPKYHAQIDNEPSCWGCGKSVIEAIGHLIFAHPLKFDVQIDYMGKNSR